MAHIFSWVCVLFYSLAAYQIVNV